MTSDAFASSATEPPAASKIAATNPNPPPLRCMCPRPPRRRSGHAEPSGGALSFLEHHLERLRLAEIDEVLGSRRGVGHLLEIREQAGHPGNRHPREEVVGRLGLELLRSVELD